MVKNYSKHWRKKTDRERNKKLTEFRNSFKSDGCIKCGSMDGLHFHHTDEHFKTKDITRIKNFKQLEAEILKTEVLCKACHLVAHSKKSV